MSTQTDVLKDNTQNIQPVGGIGNFSDFDKELDEKSKENKALSEFLSRSPEKNIELLNKESKSTGIYGYAYVTGGEPMRDIPGMNQISFQIPNDPHNGKYVGYESYEDTYKRAKSEYESAIINNKSDSDTIQKYQDATRVYDSKKIEYENYLYQHPDCPDYLSDKTNPAKAFADYVQPKEAKDALANKEASEVNKDVSIKEIESKMQNSDTFKVTTASEYESPVSEKPDEYVVQMTGTLSSETIDGMSKYAKAKNLYLPEITADKYSDEYGSQILAQMKEIDKSLSKSNPDYISVLPENTRYYKDGENPRAIPGMTMLVGKIEGAPGYYVGYESYDKTYSRSMAEYDKESKSASDAYTNDNDLNKFNLKTEELNNKYLDINATYDMQKEQYDAYKKENPGNNYLSASDAVEAFDKYDNTSPFIKKFQNGFSDAWTKIQDLLKNLGDTMRMYKLQSLGVDTRAIYTEEQALKQSSAYWEKRAELNPDEIDTKVKSDRLKTEASKSGIESSSYKDVLAGIEVDSDYEYKALSNTVDDKSNAKSKERLLTGNDMLDTLSYGNPDSSINKLVSQLPDDRVSNTRVASYSIKPEAKVIDIQADKELDNNKSQSVRRLPGQSLEDAMAASNPNKDNTDNMRSSRRAGIEALEERLKSASDMQADLSK
jgi:hypothetical protein